MDRSALQRRGRVRLEWAGLRRRRAPTRWSVCRTQDHGSPPVPEPSRSTPESALAAGNGWCDGWQFYARRGQRINTVGLGLYPGHEWRYNVDYVSPPPLLPPCHARKRSQAGSVDVLSSLSRCPESNPFRRLVKLTTNGRRRQPSCALWTLSGRFGGSQACPIAI